LLAMVANDNACLLDNTRCSGIHREQARSYKGLTEQHCRRVRGFFVRAIQSSALSEISSIESGRFWSAKGIRLIFIACLND
jgi:hypothetical protein